MLPDRIAITGATGFIGSALVAALSAAGVEMAVLSRRPARAAELFPAGRFPRLRIVPCEPCLPGDWARALEGCGGVVHLAGSPIAGRWTPEFRRAILESREAGTRALVQAIAGLRAKPAVLVSASACRYYGTSDRARFDEDSPPGPATDYLAQVCTVWEREALRAEALGLRTVILRLGIALGLTQRFRELLPGLRPFMGGRIGSGRQWVSWIHREDAVAIILRALSDAAMTGAYNATAPNPVQMDRVTDAFGRASGGLIRVPVPSLVIQQFLGDGASVILEGQCVLPRRLLAAGFEFRFPQIGPAVRDVMA